MRMPKPLIQYQGWRETLSPLVPLSLRAFKGEGEIRIGAYACAEAHAYAPNSVPGMKEPRPRFLAGLRNDRGDWVVFPASEGNPLPLYPPLP